jgi:hypothetical protein
MYLYEKVHCSTYSNARLFEKLVDATGHGDKEQYNSYGFKQPRSIEYEVGYWRKANAIHDWFVQNVQAGKDECIPHPVSVEQLEELRDTCNKVLADPSLARELLPPSSGFFFGSTEIDRRYMNELEDTVKIIDAALDNAEEHPQFEYCSSW